MSKIMKIRNSIDHSGSEGDSVSEGHSLGDLRNPKVGKTCGGNSRCLHLACDLLSSYGEVLYCREESCPYEACQYYTSWVRKREEKVGMAIEPTKCFTAELPPLYLEEQTTCVNPETPHSCQEEQTTCVDVKPPHSCQEEQTTCVAPPHSKRELKTNPCLGITCGKADCPYKACRALNKEGFNTPTAFCTDQKCLTLACQKYRKYGYGNTVGTRCTKLSPLGQYCLKIFLRSLLILFIISITATIAILFFLGKIPCHHLQSP